MYGCESWTIKKAECQRTDVFELWCWRRLFRVLWTARRSNQCILKEIRPECSLEGLMLKLRLQYFGHRMRSADSMERPSCWERLKTGGEGDNRGWDGWMASSTQWTWVWVNSRSWRWTGRPGVLQSMGSQRVGHDWANELNRTEVSSMPIFWKGFLSKWVLTLPKAFSASTEMIIWFLSFSLLVSCYHIDWFVDVEKSLHPGINSTWSWCMIL